MIGLLDGVLRELHPGLAVVDASGVGYEVHIPLSAYRVLVDQERVTLHVHTHVREDQLALYGFTTRRERDLFRALIAVSGIGPRIGLALLSGLTPDELAAAVEGEQWRRLAAVPGIGRRTAERLVVELKGKLAPSAAAARGTVREDAISALLNLGYPARAAEEAVSERLRVAPDLDLGELLREALRSLTR
ncbi:MAG: Holliday junction branch migration protein RuvA [Acidobacteriota bacterium]